MSGMTTRGAAVCAIAALLSVPAPARAQEATAFTAAKPDSRASFGLTAVEGIEVGHVTLEERPTGCTVILTRGGAVAGVDVRGGGPGTRETDLLDPVNMVQQVHAVVLSGGSAFGLDAAQGVVRWLEERDIGFPTGVARVPIVPAAILFDLGVGGKPHVRPTAECGYEAASRASSGPVAEGSIGAGAGATVGKMGGPQRAMKGGIGTASITLPNGLTVAGRVAGDVVDPATGRVIAGVRTEDGTRIADVRALLRSGALLRDERRAEASVQNTTIGVIATNARLDKSQATKVAQMAHDGYARAINPVHTPADGDAIFALATGAFDGPADVGMVGALAAEVMADAIVRAVEQATGLPGIPAMRDLADARR